RRLVRDLRARAVIDDVGARWPMAAGERAVTGLAHGSTGIGLALAAARQAGVPGASAWLVEAAWRWEDAWYSADDDGWYDLRLEEPAVGLAWCHGAPGIGIGAALRSHLGDRDGEETYLRTLRSVGTAGAMLGDGDATLCHGRSGIVELHLAGAEASWGADAATRAEHVRAARAAAAGGTASGAAITAA
ncbi:lanthionine synthetase LanC family protein, partial [Microbacterium arthrosphaerae]|uniref:lanthionine synthetase LanC family protein n=1 Tax=Microbacterium arthrosphaerae TaxID=792652 RepID=UPI0035EDC714